MSLIRQTWFRLVVLALVLCSINVLLSGSGYSSARGEAIKALQSSTFLFAICAALSIALFTNYVNGLRDAYLERVSNVRDLLEKFFDNHNRSDDEDIQRILKTYIVPLLRLNTRDWVIFDPIRDISDAIPEPATRLDERDRSFLPRHLLRIEDEINEMGRLYIRRVISGLHLKTITGTISLVAAGILALGFSYIVPTGQIGDALVVNVSATIVILAVLELLLILSYLQQEGREEQPEIEDDDEDTPQKT